MNSPRPLTFISADWGRKPRKRSVHIGTLDSHGNGRISSRQREDWTVRTLLDEARSIRKRGLGPVVVGVDAALGLPLGYWGQLRDEYASFPDWLWDRDDCFFSPQIPGPKERKKGNRRNSYVPIEWLAKWCVSRPFFPVPGERGGLLELKTKIGDGKPARALRTIDTLTGAKPIFAVNGIAGAVGWGTAKLWEELHAAKRSGELHDVRIWPFEGDQDPFANGGESITLVETYPRVAYPAALAEFGHGLPLPRVKIRKNDRSNGGPDGDRYRAVEAFRTRTEWISLDDSTADGAKQSEDQFDSLLTAGAVLRCLRAGHSLTAREPQHDVEGLRIEGTMLLFETVDHGTPERRLDQWLHERG